MTAFVEFDKSISIRDILPSNLYAQCKDLKHRGGYLVYPNVMLPPTGIMWRPVGEEPAQWHYWVDGATRALGAEDAATARQIVEAMVAMEGAHDTHN